MKSYDIFCHILSCCTSTKDRAKNAQTCFAQNVPPKSGLLFAKSDGPSSGFTSTAGPKPHEQTHFEGASGQLKEGT